MKRTRFTEEQIVAILKQSKRAAVAIARQQYGISEHRACRSTGLARSTHAGGEKADEDKQRLQ